MRRKDGEGKGREREREKRHERGGRQGKKVREKEEK